MKDSINKAMIVFGLGYVLGVGHTRRFHLENYVEPLTFEYDTLLERLAVIEKNVTLIKTKTIDSKTIGFDKKGRLSLYGPGETTIVHDPTTFLIVHKSYDAEE
jgi:hypothetical protein